MSNMLHSTRFFSRLFILARAEMCGGGGGPRFCSVGGVSWLGDGAAARRARVGGLAL